MFYDLRCASIFFGLLIAFADAAGAQVSGSSPKEVYSVDPVSGGQSFRITAYRYSSSRSVKLDNVIINPEMLKDEDFPLFYLADPDIKYYLLSHGIATLRNPSSASESDKRAVTKWEDALRADALLKIRPAEAAAPPAIADNPVAPAKPKQPEAPKGDWLGDFGAWLKVNWIPLVSIPLLGGAWAAWRRWRNTKKVYLYYMGLPASGKTSLMDRLETPDLPESHFDEDRRSKTGTAIKHAPIVASPLLIIPSSLDAPGGKPEVQLDRIVSQTDSGAKLVLLIVLAPFAEDSGVPVSENFVREQLGYIMSLPIALVRSSKTRKPAAVAVFVNKYDRFRRYRPESSHRDLLSEFSEHTAQIKRACEERKIPFVAYAGSARTADNTSTLLSYICREVTR